MLLYMSDDIIYFNISVGNNNKATLGNPYAWSSKNAGVQANFTSSILNKPNDYYGSIIRFEVPCESIPISIFYTQNTPDPNLGIYSFTMSYLGVDTPQFFVKYVYNGAYLPIPTTALPTQQFVPYYYIYNYTDLVNLWNTTLQTATTSLNTLTGQTFTAPFFVYDAPTQLISLYTKRVDNFWMPNGPQVWCNSQMLQFISSFSFNGPTYNSPNGKDNKINIKNNSDINTVNILNQNGTSPSSIPYIKTTMDFQTYGYYNYLKSIVITTSNNVNSEISYINNNDNTNIYNTQNLENISILQDFIPDLSGPSGSAGSARQIFIYNAPSLYRVFSFNQETPLNSLDLSIYFVDIYNNIYPLTLDQKTSATFKFMFIKKSIYTGMNKLLLK